MRRLFSVGLVVVGLASSSPAAAQTSRFGSISGTVADESRGALPGVTVTLTSPALQVPQIVKVTDAKGQYQFVELPTGTYRIVFELSGFARLIREDVQLPTAFAAQVDASLKVAQVEETVTVTGQTPLVDISNTRGGATLSQELLKTVPISNNYQDIVNLTPGMVVTAPPPMGDIAISGSFRSYGGASGQERTSVEGIDMRISDVPNFATVEEVDAKTYGNTAEMSTPGAAFQLIIKSGGNTFHGRYDEQYMTDRFQAKNIDAALQAQGLQAGDGLVYFQDFSGDLGGYIVRDKLWFYGAIRDQHNKRTLTGFIGDRGSDGKYGTADDVPAKPPIDNWSRTLKLSYQATPKHRFVGLYVRDLRDADAGIGATRFTPYESVLDFNYLNYQNKGEWQGVFSDRLLATVMYATSGSNSHYFSHSTEPSTHDLTTQWDTGESFHAFAQNHRFDERKQINGSMSYFPARFLGGSHEFKVGSTLWWCRFPIDTEDRPSGNYQLVFDNGVPAQLKTLNNPVHTDSRTNVFAGYITDTWRVTKRLTINLGLRADHSDLFVPPTVKSQGAFGTSGSYPRVDVASWLAWGPRVGLALSLGDGKTAVKSTYGRYNYIINEFFSTPFSPASQTTTTYRWHDLNNDKLYEPGEVNLNSNGPDFLSVTGNQTPNTSAFRLPYTHEVTASLEREIRPALSGRVLYVFKKTVDDYQSVNSARPYGAYDVPVTRADPGPDGRAGTADDGGLVTLYDYNPAYRGSQFVVNQYVNRSSDHNDHANSLELSVNKRATGRWSGQTSLLATKNYRWVVGVPQSPNDLFFPLDETWDLTYRLAGTYRTPFGVDVSTLYLLLSGATGQRTYLFRSLPQSGTLSLRLEPFGAERGPLRTALNLRASKTFALNKSRRIHVSVDALNLLNSNAAWTSDYTSGPTFGYATLISSPRVARIGAAFSF